MKISEAITLADELRPNDFSDDLKIMWLKALDAEIKEMVQFGKFHSATEGCYDFYVPGLEEEEDEDALTMPEPYAHFYVSYLCARIDEANEESDLFADDMAIYNAERQDACAWWWRNHRPRRPKYVRGL